MKREDKIEELQDAIQHNRIVNIDDLREACEKSGFDIDAYNDVLHPMEYNTCDRCGDIYDSETGFFWVDGFEWDEENPFDKAVLKAMAEEGIDYCAMCYDCLHKLANIGRDSEDVKKAESYYEEYVRDFDKACGEPVCFDEYYWNDWQEIKKSEKSIDKKLLV